MKNTLLITASIAALVAGIGLASAQGQNERRDAPAAAGSEQKAPEGQIGREKSALPQKTEKKMKPATTGQAPETAKPGTSAQAPEKAQPSERAKPLPTAQAPGKTTDSDRQSVGESQKQGAAPNAAAQKGSAEKGSAERGSAEKGSDSFASAPMSPEQNVKFRETLKGEKAERLTNVRFSISIGDEIPKSVHFYRLPARIVEYAPQYRDFDYILVGDDILIVNPRTHRIVAVISA
jgi:hypothetical protein